MLLIINVKNSKKIDVFLNSKINKASKNGNLLNHFGKLKRNLDGLN